MVPPESTPAITHSLPNWTRTGPPLSPGAVVASIWSAVELLLGIVLDVPLGLSKSVEMMLAPPELAGLP